MTPKEAKTIYDWALINAYAKGKVSAELMEEVEKMDRALGEFCPCRSSILSALPLTVTPWPTQRLDSMPEEVRRFAKASLDPGCSKCWLSSGPDIHQECRTKIKEWFDAKEALIAFGLTLRHLC